MAASAVERWERRRADWVLAHEASWTLAGRRRAGALRRRAARLGRIESGAADSPMHEGRLPWIGRRYVSRAEDPGESLARTAGVLCAATATALCLGPGLLLGGALYGASWLVLPRLGRPLRSWPWAAAAGAALVGGWLVVGPEWPWRVTPWPLELHVDWGMHWALYAWAQLLAALVSTAVRVRLWGWPAVKAARSAPTPTLPPAQRLPEDAAASAAREAPDAPGPRVPTLPPPPAWLAEEDDYDDEQDAGHEALDDNDNKNDRIGAGQ